MSTTYEAAMQRLQAVLDAPVKRGAPTQEHLMLKARTVTATDRGDFTAVVSSEAVDREQDVVLASGMVDALHKWTKVDKLIPLLWNHGTNAADVVGHVRPESAKAVNGEVIVDGWVDQSTPLGRDSWRVVKSGTAGLSFGYLTLNAKKMPDGTRLISKLDVFEVTLCIAPMNASTRIVGWKSRDKARAQSEDPDRVPTHAELLEREAALGIDDALASFERHRHMVVPPPTTEELAEREAAILAGTPFIARIRKQRAPSLDAAVERLREQTRTEMERILGGGTGKTHRPRAPRDEQRHRANRVAAEFDLERALAFDRRA
jgi:HK97 family phage prohead protease